MTAEGVKLAHDNEMVTFEYLDRSVVMKYMLLVYSAESCWTEEERRQCMMASMEICDELEKDGKWIASSPLHSVTTATSVRVRKGGRQIIDGPFAETKEQLGGYYIIDVDNLDEAIAIASRLPPVQKETIQIRPLFPLPERHALGPKEGGPDLSGTS